MRNRMYLLPYVFVQWCRLRYRDREAIDENSRFIEAPPHTPVMIATPRSFLRFGMVSLVGLAFYYAHLFLGMVGDAWMFRALAVCFLVATVPLPIIAVNNRRLFPSLERPLQHLLVMGTLLLFMHHFLMTFIFVMFLPEGRVF